jgi:hypothetical protein
MVRDLQIVLDPPPRGFYTPADKVSGKVVFESSGTETIGWVYVFFRGCVDVEFNVGGEEETRFKYIDKEVLFQKCQKVYEGYEKPLQKARFEWAFQFDFRSAKFDPLTLPTSGKYGERALSSVEYKIIAVPRRIGQTEDEIMAMMNPEDSPLPKKSHQFSPSRVFLRFRTKKIEGSSEQKLQFVHILPQTDIDPAMQGPFSQDLEISSNCLVKVPLFSQKEMIPFKIDIQYPSTVVKGVPFPFILGISSGSTLWNQNPPRVEVVSFQLNLSAVDKVRSGEAYRDERKLYRIKNWMFLHMPLGSEPVDMGHIYSFEVRGDGIITSFQTLFLERIYRFLIDLTIEVGGKSFEVKRNDTVRVEVQSLDIAPGNPPPLRQDNIAGASYMQTPIQLDKETIWTGKS